MGAPAAAGGSKNKQQVIRLIPREGGELFLVWGEGGAQGSGPRGGLVCLPAPLVVLGVPAGSAGKASACNAGDLGLIPGSGRSPGEADGNPLQCSCLENPRVGGAWWAAVHRVAESDTAERLDFHFGGAVCRGRA